MEHLVKGVGTIGSDELDRIGKIDLIQCFSNVPIPAWEVE
jgi:hypothetical protein